MTFLQFAQALEKLEQTSSRLEMTYQLADLFGQLRAGDQNLLADDLISETKLACYLMQGKLVPRYESLEFNLSVKMVQRVLAKLISDQKTESGDLESHLEVNLFGEVQESSEESNHLDEIKKLYKQKGDLGLVAQEVVRDGEDNLSIKEIYQELKKIALDGGAGSQDRKVSSLVELLKKVDAISAKFISRIVIGKLRLGFSTMTMIDGLSWAMTGSKDESKSLEAAYQKKADLGLLAESYLSQESQEKRSQVLANYSVQAGVPVVPALCQRLNSSQEIIDKMGEVLAEPKFDGLRVQIHFVRKGIESSVGETTVKAFTRNLEEVTHMFPELQTAMEHLNCDSCILDSEAIGYDPQTGKLVEFQKTIQRKRKHGVADKAQELPMRFYAFDVLELNGESLINERLQERKDLLTGLFEKNEVFFKTPYIKTNDPIQLHKFHEDQLGEGLEGAVMKKVDSTYTGGRKGWNWVKIKEEEGHQGKLSDTLDCVVMGYYRGRGKRAQFGMGAILVGVVEDSGKDEDQGQIKTIAKIGTGLTEEQLRQIKQMCDELRVEEKPANYQVHKNLVPDVWITPQIVVEVAADELTKSPTHTAGQALRFPRLVKVRNDKNPEQATKVSELEGISHLKKK